MPSPCGLKSVLSSQAKRCVEPEHTRKTANTAVWNPEFVAVVQNLFLFAVAKTCPHISLSCNLPKTLTRWCRLAPHLLHCPIGLRIPGIFPHRRSLSFMAGESTPPRLSQEIAGLIKAMGFPYSRVLLNLYFWYVWLGLTSHDSLRFRRGWLQKWG